MEEEEYLQPDWDPRTAKVAQLRGILLKHDIPYAANAKKTDLVSLFEQRVRPQSEALLATFQGIRPSQSGILDGASQDGSLKEIDTDEEELERRKKRRKSRKSFAKMDVDDDQQQQASTSKKNKNKDDVEMSDAQTPNRSPKKRKSSALLAEESSKSDRRASGKYESGGESGFSDFNPFQSPANSSPESKTKRRKSSIGPARRSSLAPPTPKAAGRKSTPAALNRITSDQADTQSNKDHRTASAKSPLPQRFSHVEIPTSSPRDAEPEPAPDSPPVRHVEPRPPSPRRIAPKSAPTVGTPGTKYMAPIGHLKKTPPELAQMRQRLASFEGEGHPGDASGDLADTSMDAIAQPVVEIAPLASKQRSSKAPPAIRWTDASKTDTRGKAMVKTHAPKKKAPETVIQRPETDDVSTRSSWSDRLEAMTTGTLVFLFVLFLFGWREEKIAAGFCDVGSSTNNRVEHRHGLLSIPSVPEPPAQVASWIDTLHLRPSCTTCPTHGSCVEGVFLGCAPEYLAKAHPLSLGGLIPLPPRCKPDTEKIMAVALQASRAAKILRRRKGEVICEGLEKARRKQENDEAFVYGIAEEQLMKALAAESEARGTVFKQQSLDELGRLALTDLMSHGEVIMSQVGSERWFATPVADLPLACRARLAAIRSAQKNKKNISTVLGVLFSILWARSKLRQRKEEQKKVRELVQTSLKKLREQERHHHIDPALAPSPAIAPSHLRDLVLAHEHSPARRRQLWNKVARVVEGNSNVRTAEVEMNGEEVRAWEWTGAPGWIPDVDAVDDGEAQEGGTPRRALLYPKLGELAQDSTPLSK